MLLQIDILIFLVLEPCPPSPLIFILIKLLFAKITPGLT